jgi:hypothetical protein
LVEAFHDPWYDSPPVKLAVVALVTTPLELSVSTGIALDEP